MSKYFFLFLLFCSTLSWTQSSVLGRVAVQGQITLQLGAPINALGFKTHLYWIQDFIEIGGGVQSKFYFSGLGPKGMFFENRWQLDAKLVWGGVQERNPVFMHSLFNHTGKAYSLSYAHFWYWDSRNTAQRSGAWATQLGRAFVYFENDLFAGQGRDRFRTGTLQVMFMDSLNLWSLNTRIWTGETRGAALIEAENYPSYRGYKDLSKSLYGTSSNGIFSLGYYRAGSFQPVGFELGIDHEWVRHFFQNKLVHDFPYIVKKNPERNRHLPMLDTEGLPYIDSSKQNLRKPRLVIQGIWGFVE